jgi:hypothetical protein
MKRMFRAVLTVGAVVGVGESATKPYRYCAWEAVTNEPISLDIDQPASVLCASNWAKYKGAVR